MAAMKGSESGTTDFEEVRRKELAYIRQRQKDTPLERPKPDASERLIGLAFSGGGIRSATTNLGIVQALSRMGVLRLVDYLSTVSGGGYIGGCLTSLLSINKQHENLAGTRGQFTFASRDDLRFGTEWWKDFPFNPDRRPSTDSAKTQFEAGVGTNIVAHLRTHGDFLVSRKSLVKRETLRAIGTLIGGLLYTVLITGLTLSVASLLLLGTAHVLSGDVKNWKDTTPEQVPESIYKVEGSKAETELRITRDGDTGTVREVTDAGFSDNLTHRIGLIWDDMTGDITAQEIGAAFGAGAVVSMIVLLIFVGATKWWKGPDTGGEGQSREDAFEIRLLTLSAALLALALVVVPLLNAQVAADRDRAAWLLQPFFVAAGAYVSAFLAYGLVLALFGSAGFLWARGSRSLWGSYLAIGLYGLFLTLLFAVLPAASYAAHAVGPAGVFGPVGSLVVGRLLMTRAVTGTAERFEISKGILHFLLGLAVVGIILLTMIEVGALAIDQEFVDPLKGPQWLLGFDRSYVIALGVSGGVLLILSFFVNLNRIGLHYFYRDRILETYLRSEVGEEAGLKTFVDTMEMPLRDVHGHPADPTRPGNTAPYLLVSAALNLAGSRDLTRKDRKSGYFLYSKYFCGSTQTGYRATSVYADGGTQLSRALTVSGAAAGTGMGYQTFFAQSFLTALFNIRLGQWVLNPRSTSNPRIAFWPGYIIREVLGLTNERTRFVNVSDGGHTGDNVGIYPLLQRRCQVIIACDAEADPAIAYGSFTEALRHAYVDLGVDVDIDLTMITPDPATGLSKAHCAIGRIRYPECPERPNWLIYMKNSLTGNEPAPVMNYKRTSPPFPHESTADQFFSDAQFESYRALGDHICEETFGRWIIDKDVRKELKLRYNEPMQKKPEDECARDFPLANSPWDDLLIRHSPFNAANSAEFRELTKTLSELEQMVTENQGLRDYYRECMGLTDLESVDTDAEAIDPVNLIVMQIQLMEDAYFSLRLDQFANARDNRGWMNLFRQWARSATFQQYFQRLHTNYSTDFVTFYCNYIHNWEPIDFAPLPHAWDVASVTDANQHPVAWKCKERGAQGFFLDPGRREAREPNAKAPSASLDPHPTGGQRDSGLPGETTSPTPTGGKK